LPGRPSALHNPLSSILAAVNGPTMNAFEAAEKNGKAAELQKELDTLFAAQNQTSDPSRTSIPATFLRVTVAV
jgi:hypothetical protein